MKGAGVFGPYEGIYDAMNKIKVWCAVFFSWLFVLYNIERLHSPINLASFVYILAAVIAIPVIMFPQPHRLSLVWLLLLAAAVTVGIKAWLGYSITAASLPLTVTELGAVGLTTVLARQLGCVLEDLRRAVISTLLTHLHNNTLPFEQGQSEIYREIRRARVHERPLAVLAVSAPTGSLEMCLLDRLTVEMQRDCVRNYVQAKIAELLSVELNNCEIITHHGNHFVTVVPEAGREQVSALAERLKKLARERLGIELSIGTSVFPDEEVTFVKLMEHAEGQMFAAADLGASDVRQDASHPEPDRSGAGRPLQPASEG